MDVAFSADSVPVLYHNETLESMTDGVGYPLDHSAAELTGCRYRTDFNSHITQNEHILRLEDILARYATGPLQPLFSFDLKGANQLTNAQRLRWRPRFARALARVVSHYGLTERVTFESGDDSLLLAIRRELPAARLYLDEDRFERAFPLAQRLGLTGLVASRNAYTKEQVAQVHAAGLRVTLFLMIRRNEILEALDKDPDAVQTDNIRLTQQMAAARMGKNGRVRG